MKRVLFYRSCTGGHDDPELTRALRALGIEHHQLPDRRGAPRIDNEPEVELGIHYSQPHDQDECGRTPPWEEARSYGLWDKGGALVAVLAAIRKKRCPTDRYLHHHEWAAAHRRLIRRVYVVSGDEVPPEAVSQFRPEFTLYGVDFVASSLRRYTSLVAAGGERIADGDQLSLGWTLWQAIQHALQNGNVPKALESSRQLALWYYQVGREEAAERVERARASSEVPAALRLLPSPSLFDVSERPGRLNGLPRFSIHLLSEARLLRPLAQMVGDWDLTQCVSIAAAREAIEADPVQVLIVDRDRDAEDFDGLRALVEKARASGMLTVSWSPRPAAGLDCELEAHSPATRTHDGFAELLKAIAARLQDRRQL
jgi:hypothetical protein